MRIVAGLALAFSLTFHVSAQQKSDPLRSGFENPPKSARPRVWWHWMNGNITREGIKLDLEWMHRVGIGGFQTFDVALNTPKVVDRRLVYMSPEWKRTFLYTTKLADRLGLEESIASSPGWSETGGPWVPAEEAMKKYVWSETEAVGGRPFSEILPRPPDVTGPFQNMRFIPDPVMPGDKEPDIPAAFYRDTTVFAYRLPEGEEDDAADRPIVKVSSGSIDADLLTDGDFAKTVDLLSAPVGQQAWIRYDFLKPKRMQSVSLALGPVTAGVVSANHGDSEIMLEASDDGEHFRNIVRLDPTDVGITSDFPAVTARYFRVAFVATAPHPAPSLEDDPDGWMGVHVIRTQEPHYEHIAELILSPAPRVHHFQEKAAFVTVENMYPLATPAVSANDVIRKDEVLDLTGRMRSDGTLDWTPPEGRWRIVRMGYSLLGITNHPATAEATGLEVDKLNHVDVRHYMNHYLDNYSSAVGKAWMGKRGIRYVVTDSWEAGAQNWTDDMLGAFARRRGYDAHPWLPVLTGHIVESSEASDAFLWDFRKTIADLTADEHYGEVQASLKARGLGHYGESHEGGRALIADGMEVKKLDDIPMGAMWTQRPGINEELFSYEADDRESASVAHIYGQNLAAAESMTAVHDPWAWSPADLKPTADREFAEGINRIVIHCSVHQPLVGKVPGLGLGPYGQWFNRNESWAEQAKPWIDYLSRSSFLLQQGRFNADIAYFYGEDSNITAIFGEKGNSLPEGYGFDYVNADALMHAFSMKAGKLTTRSGMSYSLLVLDPNSRHMSLPVLRSLRDLVRAGAVLAGPKPMNTPSLADDKQQFVKIVDELWGYHTDIHPVGRGKVYPETMGLAEVLHISNIKPDFTYTKSNPGTKILFVHRKLMNGELYYLDNRTAAAIDVQASFRVTGRAPELWHADSGGTEDAAYEISDGRTNVPLHLEPWGTVFVVFRKPAQAATHKLPVANEALLTTLSGPWKVEFQPERGAPAALQFETLSSWTESAVPGVKYFSGSGTYVKTIFAPSAWFPPGAQLWLELGSVKNLAAVTVNGMPVGSVWHAPFRLDVTKQLKPGPNEVRVQVTNAWANRIIGDLQPDATEKYTFTVIRPYSATSPLWPSGLLGPVRVVQMSTR